VFLWATHALLCFAQCGWAQDADALETYRIAPICLKATSTIELSAVPGFSPRVAQRVLAVASKRPLWTIDNIADSLCLTVAQRIMLHSCATTMCLPGKVIQGAVTVRLGDRLEQPRGIRDSVWFGSSMDNVQKLDLRYGSHRLTLLTSTASGEAVAASWASGNAGVDIGALRVTLGDYTLSVARGLVFGSAANTRGPWTSALNPASVQPTIRPWTSGMRFGFLRGVAVVGAIADGTEAALKISVRQLAARIDTAEGRRVVTSIDRMDVVRTPSDENRDAVAESVVGATVAQRLGSGFVGAGLWVFDYDAFIDTRATWTLRGLGGTAVSVYGEHTLFGAVQWEVARSPTGALAGAAMWTNEKPKQRTIAGARWIAADYRAPYGATLTDASTVANEAGVTIGTSWRGAWGRLDGVIDVRQSLTRTTFVPAIVRGATADVQYEQTLWRLGSIGARILYESETDGVRGADSSRTVAAERQKLRLRANAAMRLSVPLTVTVRADVVGVQWSAVHTRQIGMAAQLGVRYNQQRWGAAVQWTTYNSPTADAAPYVGESAVPGVLRSIALVGSGVRMLLRMRWQALSWCSITAAYVEARRTDVATLGSGWDALEGSIDRRVMLNIGVRFRSTLEPRFGSVDDDAALWLE